MTPRDLSRASEERRCIGYLVLTDKGEWWCKRKGERVRLPEDKGDELGRLTPTALRARDQAILGCDTGRCDSCANLRAERGVCPASERDCGHHCNHSWSHERCCWCGEEWGDG